MAESKTETHDRNTAAQPGRRGKMKRFSVAAALAVALVSFGCQQAAVDEPAWFAGTFEEALASAQSRSTMLMLDFYSPT